MLITISHIFPENVVVIMKRELEKFKNLKIENIPHFIQLDNILYSRAEVCDHICEWI